MDPKRRLLFERGRAALASRRAAREQAKLAETPVREVTMTALTRSPSRIVAAVRAGEVVVLSKHRRAVAMIVPLFDEPELAPLDVGRVERLGELAKVFRGRAADRRRSALMHGRWYGKRYARYRRGRGRGR